MTLDKWWKHCKDREAKDSERTAIKYSNGSIYFGIVKSQQRDDKDGELAWFSGGGDKDLAAIFYGKFEKGAMTSGTIIYKGNSRYAGSWKNGKWEDKDGVYTRADGTVYKGNFTNGMMQGDNFEIKWEKAGVKYNGAVSHNKLHGRGTLTYSDNTEISGIWKNDTLDRTQPHTLKLKDKSIEALDLFDPETGQLTGKGTLKMNNCTYEGTWQNGKLNCDDGVMKQSDGGVYKGQFVDNVRQG